MDLSTKLHKQMTKIKMKETSQRVKTNNWGMKWNSMVVINQIKPALLLLTALSPTQGQTRNHVGFSDDLLHQHLILYPFCPLLWSLFWLLLSTHTPWLNSLLSHSIAYPPCPCLGSLPTAPTSVYVGLPFLMTCHSSQQSNSWHPMQSPYLLEPQLCENWSFIYWWFVSY